MTQRWYQTGAAPGACEPQPRGSRPRRPLHRALVGTCTASARALHIANDRLRHMLDRLLLLGLLLTVLGAVRMRMRDRTNMTRGC